MSAIRPQNTARVPVNFLVLLALGLGFFAFAAWDESHWWRVLEDYSFGWLAPIFAVFVVHDRWPKITAALAACAQPGSPRAAGWKNRGLLLVVGLALAAGGILFLLAALYRSRVGSSYPGSQAIALGMAATLLALVFISAPSCAAPAPAGWWDDARVRLAGLFVFPCCVWLVAAPMVSSVDAKLKLVLLNKVVSVVSFVFDTLGLPIQQQANVLVLPPVNGLDNRVGVEDACSGIRSLTGCLFAGSFLAAVFLDRWWKKILLVVCAMILAFCTNLIRGLFLTAWAYNYGSKAIEGTVHDAAGYSVLGLTVVGLLCLLPLFNLKFAAAKPPAAAPGPEQGPKN